MTGEFKGRTARYIWPTGKDLYSTSPEVDGIFLMTFYRESAETGISAIPHMPPEPKLDIKYLG